MTTELVILLTIFVLVISRIVGLPAKTFDEAGPKLGMRIEKQIETGAGFTYRTQSANDGVDWTYKP